MVEGTADKDGWGKERGKDGMCGWIDDRLRVKDRIEVSSWVWMWMGMGMCVQYGKGMDQRSGLTRAGSDSESNLPS